MPTRQFSPDQLTLDFAEAEPIEVVPFPFPRRKRLPDAGEGAKNVHVAAKKEWRGRFSRYHFERRTERIEPKLPDGVRPEDCELIGVDVVEILEFDRPRLWVRRWSIPNTRFRASRNSKLCRPRGRPA